MWNLIPNSIKELHQLFEDNDKHLFVVGGAVRDFLLGTKIKDFDLATDALPDEVLLLCKKYRTNEVGKSFGVIIVYTEEGEYEIATFRTDQYGDKLGETRNPAVKFSTIDKDVLRRDLTCGALFYDLEEQEIIDLVGGIEDIRNKTIRFVGNADLRIEEDPLRILRAIRFSRRYNFNIDEKSLHSISNNANKLKIITKERIWEEISDKAWEQSINFSNYMEGLIDTGIVDVIFEGMILNKIVKEFSSLELYFVYLFIENSTEGMLNKLKFEFKMEHDFSRKVVFLIDLFNLKSAENIQNLYKKSEGISSDVIIEWLEKTRLINSKIHKAFLKYKPVANALELMEQGFQGKKLGAKIKEIEIDHFKQLIDG